MHLRMIFILTLVLALVNGAGSASANDTQTSKPPGALTTIAKLDVSRYLGTWVEIAKYPNRFQKKCVGDTRAHYSLQADGKVRVLNRCVTKGGEVSEALGEARQIGDSTSPRLEVRFAPAWLSPGPRLPPGSRQRTQAGISLGLVQDTRSRPENLFRAFGKAGEKRV